MTHREDWENIITATEERKQRRKRMTTTTTMGKFVKMASVLNDDRAIPYDILDILEGTYHSKSQGKEIAFKDMDIHYFIRVMSNLSSPIDTP